MMIFKYFGWIICACFILLVSANYDWLMVVGFSYMILMDLKKDRAIGIAMAKIETLRIRLDRVRWVEKS